MSKSRRAAQGQGAPVPPQNKNLWTTDGGEPRTGWLLLASLIAYALAALLTRYGLVRAFAALFRAWGVDADTVHLAPAWARLVYTWHGSLVTLCFAGLLLAIVGGLRRLWGLTGNALPAVNRGLWRGALTGVAATLLFAALCLLPDSMRPEWPLGAPRFRLALPVVALVGLASTLAEEAFTKRLIYDGLRHRWNRLWSVIITCAVFWLVGGGYAAGVIGAVNVLLLGFCCVALYEHCGLWASAGFRWGWSMAQMLLLGFGGGESAIYRLYAVSETWLTGGDAGPMYGLWATLFLAGLSAWMMLKRK